MKDKILYIGNFSFPLGNAAGKRVYANGKIFNELGYDVIYIGLDNNISKETLLKTTKSNYDGFDYYNLPYPKGSLDWLNYRKEFKKVISFLAEERISSNLDMVICYGSPRLSLFNALLLKWCKKNKIKIISDCVDWLSVNTGKKIFDLVKWLDTIYQKAYFNKKVDGLIVISRYLQNYYKKSNKKVCLLPPLAPIKYDLSYNHLEKKIICYAGNPFRKNEVVKNPESLKDRIDKMVYLLYRLKEKGCDNFIFNIFGMTKEEYLYAIPNHKKYIENLDENIIFYGKISNKIITKNISEADFTFLIRDVKRDTMAGFPTKVSESISCGTLVIANNTSDLKEYIVEGENGYFLENKNSENDLDKLEYILKLKKEKINEMKKQIILNNIFYYKKFINKTKLLMMKL